MEKEISGVKVNDGKGFLDNEGLVDSIILDCNSAVKTLIDGNYINWCNMMVIIIQKLSNLKEGIKTDTESRDKEIADLSEALERMKAGE